MIEKILIESKQDIKKDIIGKYFKTGIGEIYIVEDYAFHKDGENYYQLRFMKDGYRTYATYKNAKRGYSYSPYVCDGTLGTIRGNVDNSYPNLDKIKLRYDDMIDRNYNPKNKGYARYGGSGVRVDVLWHNFENYFNDVTSQKGFHPALLCQENFIQLDKDYLQLSVKNKYDMVYSKYTTMWLLSGFNSGFTKRETYKYILKSAKGKLYYAVDLEELENILKEIAPKSLDKFLEIKKEIEKKKKNNEIKIGSYILTINK